METWGGPHRKILATSPEVRPLVPGDASSVRALLAHSLRDLYPGGPDWLEDRLAELAVGDLPGLISTCDRTVSGVVLLKPAAPAVKIRTFYVAPAWRGKGHGRRLLAAVHSALRADHIDESYVTVAAHLRAVIAFFEGAGYLQSATELHRYGHNRHEAILTRLDR